MVCLWCGRTVSQAGGRAGGRSIGVRSHDYQNFTQILNSFIPNGDGNENGKKKKRISRSNLQKKASTTTLEQQTFLFISFPLMLQPDTSWLHVLCLMCSQKILLPLFLFAFFTTTFLIFSPPLKNFYVVLPRKFVSFVCCCCFCSCFLSLALALCRSFSR